MANAIFERILVTDDNQDLEVYTISNTKPVVVAIIAHTGETGQNSAHIISDFQIYLKKVGTPVSDISVEFRTATATTIGSTILGEATIAKSSVGTSYGYVSMTGFSTPTIPASGYFAVVLRVGINTNTNGYVFGVEEQGVSGYSTLGYTTLDETTWSEINIFNVSNLAFYEYGGTWGSSIVQYSELIDLAGKGASATAKGINVSKNFVENAEGFVNAVTKYDWDANWSSINAKAKKLVKEAIMCLAAKSIVDYDTDGYSSRFEAQYISESLQMRSDKAVAALMEEDIKAYVQSI